jgi:methylmalonyl-CoA/ethylmalonyl-CoA epimerase
MSYRLMHIGIAVRDAAKAVGIFGKLLNVPVTSDEMVPDQKVRAILYHIDGSGIELLEPTSTDSPIARFLEKRGEGVHHLSFEVDDIETELERLKVLGFGLVDEKPRRGAGGHRIAFLHPKTTNGVLIEISQRTK